VRLRTSGLFAFTVEISGQNLDQSKVVLRSQSRYLLVNMSTR
jgi:hypothetical protein